jgi:hypothetical protein
VFVLLDTHRFVWSPGATRFPLARSRSNLITSLREFFLDLIGCRQRKEHGIDQKKKKKWRPLAQGQRPSGSQAPCSPARSRPGWVAVFFREQGSRPGAAKFSLAQELLRATRSTSWAGPTSGLDMPHGSASPDRSQVSIAGSPAPRRSPSSSDTKNS